MSNQNFSSGSMRFRSNSSVNVNFCNGTGDVEKKPEKSNELPEAAYQRGWNDCDAAKAPLQLRIEELEKELNVMQAEKLQTTLASLNKMECDLSEEVCKMAVGIAEKIIQTTLPHKEIVTGALKAVLKEFRI